MSIPTPAEQYAILMEHLRKAQEAAAMLAHLQNDGHGSGKVLARGWLNVSEGLKQMLHIVTTLAMGKLN